MCNAWRSHAVNEKELRNKTFTRVEMWNLLERLRTSFICSNLLATHGLHEAVYLANKVHVMSKQAPGDFVFTQRKQSSPRPREPS
jgi:ABC-type nitrate/sulfonate/bicarbonate transport system ATPase subunit